MLTVSAVRDDQNQMTHYVALFSDITERKASEAQVWQLAFYDPLTQLPNRRLLNDRLAQAMAQSERNGQYGAVMFLDMDNFKPLNDEHGHGAGDLLLVEVAQRLKCAVRGMDTVARMGGDEFVVLLSELGENLEAARLQALSVAEKMRAALAEPYCLHLPQPTQDAEVLEHNCTASVGVALYWQQTVGADQLLQWADAAMYQAKALGRNRVQLHAA